MTKKIELILSALFMGGLCGYTLIHPEKYHLCIPILHGICFLIAMYLLLTLDKDEK